MPTSLLDVLPILFQCKWHVIDVPTVKTYIAASVVSTKFKITGDLCVPGLVVSNPTRAKRWCVRHTARLVGLTWNFSNETPVTWSHIVRPHLLLINSKHTPRGPWQSIELTGCSHRAVCTAMTQGTTGITIRRYTATIPFPPPRTVCLVCNMDTLRHVDAMFHVQRLHVELCATLTQKGWVPCDVIVKNATIVPGRECAIDTPFRVEIVRHDTRPVASHTMDTIAPWACRVGRHVVRAISQKFEVWWKTTITNGHTYSYSSSNKMGTKLVER